MGTRADFYVGRGKHAEWLGSIAWDGYWDGIDQQILQCTSEAAFRHAVAKFIGDRDDGTKPEQGWPWPWETSDLTDCAYAFDAGQTWQECFKHWLPADSEFSGEKADLPTGAIACEWPDMSDRQNVSFGARSGLVIVVGR